jgi:hypothetical protein
VRLFFGDDKGHIPCIGTSFLHVSSASVVQDYPLKLPGGHYKGTSYLHELRFGVDQVYPL